MADISKRYSHLFKNSSLSEIANSRSNPAILLLNSQFKIVFYNSEALDVLNSDPFFLAKSSKKDKTFNLSPEIIQYCNKFMECMNNRDSLANFPPLITKDPEKNQHYCVRLVPTVSTENRKERKYDSYFVLLFEKISSTENLIASFQLSKREKEVLELLFIGLSNKEIAEKLYISVYTVEDHIKNLINKMNVKNRLSVVLKFIDSNTHDS